MISPRSIDQSSAATAATTATATRTAGTGAGIRIQARDPHVLTGAIVLRLAIGLHLQGAEENDAVAFLQAADHFREIEVALSELHDAGREMSIRRVGRDEHEA